jgi:hypothetical protein
VDSRSNEPEPAKTAIPGRNRRSRFLVSALFVVVALLTVPFLIWSIRRGHIFPTLERVAVAALLGGLVGGISGFVGSLFNPTGAQTTSGRFAGIGIALSLVLSGPILKGLSQALNPGDDLEARLTSLPEFSAWAAKANGHIKDEMAYAVRRGLRRLDDASLAKRLELMSTMEARGDARTCAAIERGTATSDDLETLIRGLSTDDQKQFYDVIFHAAAAELRGSPKRRWVSQQRRDDFHAAIRTFLENQPDGKRVLAVLGDPGSSSDAELCKASQAVYQAANSMSGDRKKDGYLILLSDGGGGHPLLESPHWLSLDDESLVARAEILAALFAFSDEAKCAALARDAASDDEVSEQLEKLPAELQGKWKDLSRQLMAASGPDRAIPAVDYRSFAVAMNQQLRNKNFDDHAYEKPDSVSAAEACRARSTFVLAALRVPKPLLGIAGRVLAGGTPQ